MKKIILMLILLMILSACQLQDSPEQKVTNEENQQESSKEEEENMEITMSIGEQDFRIYLENNESAQALLEKLPMTFTMKELNGNEKYYNMDQQLPTNQQDIGKIETGDVMLFGDNCLVIFYESFSTSYRYTRLGKVEDGERFADIARQGKNIEVSLSK